MRYSGIGGQAVLEGVMMRNADKYAVSVRTPDGNIQTKVERHKSLRDRYAFLNVPIVRGVISFAESLVMGIQTLNYSADLWEEEEKEQEKKGQNQKEQSKKEENQKAKKKKEQSKKEENQKEQKNEDKKNETEGLWMGLAVMLGVILAIGLFVLLPFFVSELLSKVIRSVQLRGLIEGVIRVTLFVSYVKAISYMEDIRRVFMYHGAEHKCINCVESGHELTVENAKRQTTVHKRCGTSFMLVVMFVSILFFMFISVSNMWIRMLLRILLIPVIAGVSYEFIMFAGKSENPVVAVLSMPGMWLQSLTTKEPDEDMLEVAIASVESVFDWKQFLKEGTETPAAEAAVTKEKEKDAVKPADFEVVEMGEEDDDEILQALDRYFDDPANSNSGGKTSK